LFRLPSTSRSCRRRCTLFASSPWTAVRISQTPSDSGWGTRVAGGRAILWWSKPPTRTAACFWTGGVRSIPTPRP
jgi:hypothetical protein